MLPTKTVNPRLRCGPLVTRTTKTLQFFLFFSLALMLQANAKGFTQVNVSLKLQKATLEEAFKEIHTQTGFGFIFFNDQLLNTKPVTLTLANVLLEKALEACFRNQPVTYEVNYSTKSIVISDRNESISKAVPPIFTIKGKVVNDAGEAVAGATIRFKETGQIIFANDNGEFKITSSDNTVTLIFTSVGYESREIAYNGEAFVTVLLRQMTNVLDETLVIAYGTTTKRLATESVSKVKAVDIERQPVGNFLGSLEGRVPGLQITQVTGAPGKSFTVRLRGQNSINSGNEPLYLVDGVPINSVTMDNPNFVPSANYSNSVLFSINPLDIESIEILKDADATAIYGSRGANGVILITTKRGKAGKTHFSINVNKGVGLVTRKLNFLNSQDYLKLRHEAFANDGVTQLPSNAYDLNGAWDTTRYTDWQKIMVGGKANYTDVQGSLTGGNVNTQFLISGNYHRETTVFPGDDYVKRGSVSFNLNHVSPNGKLKVGLSSFYSKETSFLAISDFTKYSNLVPVAPALYDSSGKLNWQSGTWTNPLADLYKTEKDIIDYLTSNFTITYELLHGLQLKTTLGYSTQIQSQTQNMPALAFNPANSPISSSNFGSAKRQNWIIEPQVSYLKQIAKGKFHLLFGASFNNQESFSSSFTGTGYPSDALINNLQAANSIQMTSNTYSLYKYAGAFGRANFTWDDKYLFNLTARRDGSSRFGTGKQFSNFGAIGLGWIFTNERFVSEHFGILSYGKLRVTYGITGNDQIGDYQFLNTYTPYSTTYQGNSTLYPVRLLNTNYAWERNKKNEVGLELGFFKDKVLFSFDYYNNRSSNQLLSYQLPSITGFTTVIQNLGAEVGNTGFEFDINTSNIKGRNFKWSSSINLTIPKNKLISYPNIESSPYATRYIVGKSLFIAQTYHYTGVNPSTGLYTFEDYDKDNKISSPNDSKFVVYSGQQYYGGLQNDLSYKRVQVVFLIQFSRQKFGQNLLAGRQLPMTLINQPSYVLERWQAPGQIATVQQVSNSNTLVNTAYNTFIQSDQIYSDASYARLKNISISYTFSNTEIKKLGVQNIKVYLQGQNLITVTKYRGLDPENKGALPPLSMYTCGVQIIL